MPLKHPPLLFALLFDLVADQYSRLAQVSNNLLDRNIRVAAENHGILIDISKPEAATATHDLDADFGEQTLISVIVYWVLTKYSQAANIQALTNDFGNREGRGVLDNGGVDPVLRVVSVILDLN